MLVVGILLILVSILMLFNAYINRKNRNLYEEHTRNVRELRAHQLARRNRQEPESESESYDEESDSEEEEVVADQMDRIAALNEVMNRRNQAQNANVAPNAGNRQANSQGAIPAGNYNLAGAAPG